MGGLITFLLFIVAGCAGDVNPGTFFYAARLRIASHLAPPPRGHGRMAQGVKRACCMKIFGGGACWPRPWAW